MTPQELMHTLPKAKFRFFFTYGRTIVTSYLLFGYKSAKVSEGTHCLVIE